MLKKLICAALMWPLLALAQSYPSPTFQNFTVNGTATIPHAAITGGTISGTAITGGTISGLSSPLGFASGGTNAATQSAALSNILGSSTIPIANGGTNCASASGTCLDNVTGFNSTGFMSRSGAGAYTFTASTGTGSVVLANSPTLTNGTTINGAAANTTTITANSYSSTQSSSNVATVDYQFNALADYGSFADTTTHFGFVVNGGKSTSTTNTTGSWQLFRAGYTGYGGGDASAYITAAQMIVQPTASSFNNSGNFTGANPECIIPTGMTPTSCVAAENDVKTSSQPTNIREGLRISDIGSAAGTFGVNTDAGIGIVNGGGIGFNNGIVFGDLTSSATFPVPAGGRLIQSVSTTNALQSFIDFSNISGVPTSAALTLPGNIREACFGSVGNCTGGAIVSNTTANGGQLVFGNNSISFNWAGAAFTANSNGNISSTGTGVMPLFGATGTPVNAPHMVQGTATLSSGAATVTLSGSAVFTSSSSYACTANDTTAAAPVKVSQTSGTSITFAGTGTDVVQFMCAGN